MHSSDEAEGREKRERRQGSWREEERREKDMGERPSPPLREGSEAQRVGE